MEIFILNFVSNIFLFFFLIFQKISDGISPCLNSIVKHNKFNDVVLSLEIEFSVSKFCRKLFDLNPQFSSPILSHFFVRVSLCHFVVLRLLLFHRLCVVLVCRQSHLVEVSLPFVTRKTCFFFFFFFLLVLVLLFFL